MGKFYGESAQIPAGPGPGPASERGVIVSQLFTGVWLGEFAGIRPRSCFYKCRRYSTMLITHHEDDLGLAYDIFRKFAEGGPIWIETVRGMETCKSRLHDLVLRNHGEYFAFDPLHSRVVAQSAQ